MVEKEKKNEAAYFNQTNQNVHIFRARDDIAFKKWTDT